MSQVSIEHSESVEPRESPLLSVRNLIVQFVSENQGVLLRKKSTLRAVNDVSFDLFESETVALVGESGSGKSTIARCLSLLTRPNSGSIEFGGKDILRLRGDELREYHREVQMIFQDPFESFNPRETVFSAVSAPLRRLCGIREKGKLVQDVTELLEEVGLNPELLMNRYPHELSGGERQRVSIARALACKPKVLIADEPITMLDAAQRLNILYLLNNLKKNRQLTLLMITHDLASARILSDRVLVIYLGKLVETGNTKDVLSRPHHPYVELIMNAIPRIREASSEAILEDETELLTSIEGSYSIMEGCPFRPRCKYSTEVCAKVEPDLEEKTESHFGACHNALNTQITTRT